MQNFKIILFNYKIAIDCSYKETDKSECRNEVLDIVKLNAMLSRN